MGDPSRDQGTAALQVTSRSGRVVVRARAVDRPQVVHGDAEILPSGEVRGRGSERVEIACPEGSHLIIGTSSGRVDCHGRLGRVAVTSASGRVSIEAASEIDVRTTSGRVVVRSCEGSCRVATRSGTVQIDAADAIHVSTSSARVVAPAVGDASVRGGSGRVALGLNRPGTVEVRTVSGAVIVTLAPGVTPVLDLQSRTGRVEADVTAGGPGHVVVETSSGHVRVVPS